MKHLIQRKLRLYLDTSVPNFLFAIDAPDKKQVTELFFKVETQRYYSFFVSGVVLRELEKAPLPKRARLLSVVASFPILELTPESESLAQAYLSSGVVPNTSDEDARHVAIATISNMDAVVSWNFKHLVNLRRLNAFNIVNEQMGYKNIEIISPLEVIE